MTPGEDKNQGSGIGEGSAAIRERLDATRLLALVILLNLGTGVLGGQTTESAGAAPGEGFRIDSVSTYGDYYSSGVPVGSRTSLGAVDIPFDVGYGGGVKLSWLKLGKEGSAIAFTYAPMYTARARFSELNNLNHSLSFSANGRFARRWNAETGLSASLRSQDQFLFSPTVFSSVASAPGSFDELAGAVLAGRYTDAQLASILTGAPVVESPAQNLFFAPRMFSADAGASLAYSHSPRLSTTFSVGGGHREPVKTDRPDEASSAGSFIPTATFGGTGVSLSYAVTPRTQIGASAESQYVTSLIQSQPLKLVTTSGLASLGRTLNRRWFFEVRGGIGIITPIQEGIFVVSTDPQPVGGGLLGFRTGSHTLLASYDRRVGNTYGYAANATTSIGGTWRWSRPGRSWWVESGVSWQELPANNFEGSSWLATAGFGRSMGKNVSLLNQFSYLRYSARLSGSPFDASQFGVRLSLIWVPESNRLW